MTPHLPALLLARKLVGFTMIELLIVITILGILAVAVLSAINPIEQINRGRDTSYQSDSEQMISAIERYNAFTGYYPWSTMVVTDAPRTWVSITDAVKDVGNTCPILGKLSSTAIAGCIGTDELKKSFIQRLNEATRNKLFLYNRGNQGDSTYVCFLPQSKAFKNQAKDRCELTSPGKLPEDLKDIWATVCTTPDYFVCLP